MKIVGERLFDEVQRVICEGNVYNFTMYTNVIDVSACIYPGKMGIEVDGNDLVFNSILGDEYRVYGDENGFDVFWDGVYTVIKGGKAAVALDFKNLVYDNEEGRYKEMTRRDI